MEKYFGINYEFDVSSIHSRIASQVAKGEPGYICAPDCNVLTEVHCNRVYHEIVNRNMFSICDSSWVPIFIRWIYGKKYYSYRGSDIFIDVIKSRKYRMIFLGTKQEVLEALQKNLVKENPDIMGMTFKELPFCKVEDFDYPAIARLIKEDGADIIWVALGAPKQEQFMSMLTPHLKKGVCIAVGAVFNFFSGLASVPKRAPKWMVKWRIEFVHRIFIEPKKQIKRCWGIVVHLPRILWEERCRKRRHEKSEGNLSKKS